jgi:vancomycin resistance protein YoaR
MKLLKCSIILIFLSFLLSGCYNNKIEKEGNKGNNVDFSRTSITKESTDNADDKNNNADNNNNNDNDDDKTNNENSNNSSESKETELSTFSTPLKSGVANRITNIKLTCNKINEHVLKPGDTFSFNQLVGPCTAEEGYKKAEIYVNKKIVFALGGGNCQVSTTLYNAALAVPGLDITERHEHNGRAVDYIEDGKDATVSYNTKDLKLTNNTGKNIKLYTWCDDVNVCAKITQIE